MLKNHADCGDLYGGTVGIKWVVCVFVKCHFLWLNKKRLCNIRYTKNMLKTDKNADKLSKNELNLDTFLYYHILRMSITSS